MKKLLFVLFLCPAACVFANNPPVPDSARWFVENAMQSASVRNFRLAEQYYEKAVALAPKEDSIRLHYARYLLTRNQYPQALEQFNTVIQRTPDHELVLVELVEFYTMHRRWDELVTYATRLQQIRPSDNNLYQLGRAYYYKDNYGQAAKNLEAVAGRINTSDCWTMLAKTYVELGDYKKAIQFHEKAIAADPSKPILLYELALMYSSIPDHANSVRYMEEAAAKGLKQDLVFKENLAISYMELKNLEKGIAIYNEILEMKPNNQDILFQIAQAYYKNKDYNKAIDYWQKIIDAYPDNNRALYMMGMAYQRAGKVKKGIELCEKAIASDPSLARLRQEKIMF